MTDLYGCAPARPSPCRSAAPQVFVAGVWRDYANQSGSVVVRLATTAR
jgi:putative ABC transport system permease protein